ncbi:MAG: PEGA domain-containing protein [Byssovorax sp.]
MTLGREHVSPLRAAMAALCCAITLAPVVSASAQPAAALPPQAAPADTYKLHMENGVKLFEDRNYDAARAEFRAAYEARPRASPLINIALAHKAEFNYPKAIEALEAALAKHQDTMSAGDIKAAEGELKDMRALLARVHLVVTPASASVTIDGEALPAAALAQPIALGPGTHKIAASAEGFAPMEQRFTVASGESTELALKLVADQGTILIEAPDPRMTIAVDQHVVGAGTWKGLLPPGSHLVQIAGPGGQPFTADILVVAGKPLTIRPGSDLFPPLPPSPPPRKDPPVLPPKHGLYLIAMASLLFPTSYPTGFPQPKINSGGAGGLRVGYQVNGVAGFNGFFEHSSLFTPTKTDATGGSTLISNRIGAELRLMTPGKTVRAVGAIGGGVVLDSLSFEKSKSGCTPVECEKASGADPFFLLEAGLEFEFSGVLLGAVIESQFQSSRGISTATDSTPPYSNNPLVHLGPGLRVGYAFW